MPEKSKSQPPKISVQQNIASVILKKIKDLPLCYDDGLTTPENEESFICGEAHMKEHCKNIIKKFIK